jgi:CheY-like chemotaxis protein/nitrogen-specific signal transduction histidine kinase
VKGHVENIKIIKVGAALGVGSLVCNLVLTPILGAPLPLQLGNALTLLAAYFFGVLGAVSALISGAVPFSLYQNEPLDFLRFGAIAVLTGIVASKNSKLNLSSVVLLCWMVGLAFNEDMDFLKTINTRGEIQGLFWSDLLSATLAATLILNPSIRCYLAKTPVTITLLYFNTQLILSFSALLTFIGYSISMGVPTPILSLVLFITALQVSATLFGYLWTMYLKNNLWDFAEDPLVANQIKNKFSGSNSSYWRKVTRNSANNSIDQSWHTPFRTASLASSETERLSTHNKPAVCAINSTGEIIFATPTFADLLLLPLNEIVGRDIDALTTEAIWKNVIKDVALEAFTSGPQTQELKIANDNQSEYFEISGRIAAGPRQDGRPGENDSVMIAIRNITGRFQVEDAQLNSHKIQTLGSLVSGITHAFSNYLTAVAAKATVITDAQNSTASAQLKQIKEYTSEAGEMLRGLISLISNNSEQPKLTNLAYFIEERLNIFSKLIDAKNNIVFSKSNETLGTICNRSLLDQVLTNLIVYARDAYGGEAGNINLNISLEVISTEAARLAGGIGAGPYCRIDMTHEGKPMSRHLLSSLFDASHSSFQGSLGLSIITAIVKSQDGFVTAKSGVGKLTTLSLYFPWHEVDNRPQQGTKNMEWPDSPLTSLKGKKILIVEDEPTVREMTSLMLSTLGCQILNCETGERALELATQNRFDIVLIDYMLPSLSGEPLLERMKTVSQESKILIMTGYGTNVSSELASAIVSKPFDLDTLAAAINHALGQTVH